MIEIRTTWDYPSCEGRARALMVDPAGCRFLLPTNSDEWPGEAIDLLRRHGVTITGADDTPMPLDPITCSGWYELEDRRWQEFVEYGDHGDFIGGRVVDTFEDTMEEQATQGVVALKRDDYAIELMCDVDFRRGGIRYHIVFTTTAGEQQYLTGTAWVHDRSLAQARVEELIESGAVARR